MLFQDDLDNDEPIPNLANFFVKPPSTPKESASRKKKKSEPMVNKRQRLGKIEKVRSRFARKIYKINRGKESVGINIIWAEFLHLF